MERASFAYVVLGAAVAVESRSRTVLSGGARAARLATWPAAQMWRSPIASPVRTRTAALVSALDRDGRIFAARTGERARDTGEPLAALADRLLAAGIADDIVDRLLDSGALDRMITVAINHPATDALVQNALDEPGMERLIGRVMESRLIDDVTLKMLESSVMQRVLDHVTHSPELRAALAQQTTGLAGDVADRMRSRTDTADARVERFAQSLLRRGNRSKDE